MDTNLRKARADLKYWRKRLSDAEAVHARIQAPTSGFAVFLAQGYVTDAERKVAGLTPAKAPRKRVKAGA